MKPGRNDPCPCGSGLKYKKCHGPKDEAARSAELAAQAAARAKEAAAAEAKAAEEKAAAAAEGTQAPEKKPAARRPEADAPPAPTQKGFSTAKLPRRGAV